MFGLGQDVWTWSGCLGLVKMIEFGQDVWTWSGCLDLVRMFGIDNA